MDIFDVVAWNLRRLRVRLSLSQEALGLRADVDRTYVGRLERGLENPTVAVLARLSNAMGVPVADLFAVPRAQDPKPSPLRGGRRAGKKHRRGDNRDVGTIGLGRNTICLRPVLLHNSSIHARAMGGQNASKSFFQLSLRE